MSTSTSGRSPGLSFMKRLSPSVTYFEPPPPVSPDDSTSTQHNGRRDPELILLLSWMGAREEHIAKYVHKHHELFPTSRILVAQCPLSHVFFPLFVWLHARPVIPILKELVDAEFDETKNGDIESLISSRDGKDGKEAPRVLIHAFSNGGVSTAIQIYRQLKAALGGTLRLPSHVFVFDSCPGWFRWKSTAKAIGQKLPRWTAPIIHSLLFSVWMIYKLPFIQPAQNVNARLIRNPNYVKSEVRRTYLYGTRDDLIYPADVEEQAAQAAKAGFDVRLEKFEGALHCAIARDHGERYWRVVLESWEGPNLVAADMQQVKTELDQSGVLVGMEESQLTQPRVEELNTESEPEVLTQSDVQVTPAVQQPELVVQKEPEPEPQPVELVDQEQLEYIKEAVVAASKAEEVEVQEPVQEVNVEKSVNGLEDPKTDAAEASEADKVEEPKEVKSDAVSEVKTVKEQPKKTKKKSKKK